MEIKEKKLVLIITGAVALILSFVLSDSFRNTLSRRHAIHQTEQQMKVVDQETLQLRDQIHGLEASPAKYEDLVRQELGYLRPGEKEVRFLKQ